MVSFEGTPNTSYNPSGIHGLATSSSSKVRFSMVRAENLHGMPVDSICYTVKFDDDQSPFISGLSGTRWLRVH